MVKLIVSDIDGTLLHGAESTLNPELFDLIAELNRRGILFAPASGRQYHSLRKLFAPVEGELCYLCENGAEVYGPSEQEETAVPLSMSVMPKKICDPLIDHILEDPSRSVLISCSNLSYLICRHEAFLDRIANFTGNRFQVVQDRREIGQPIIKIAAYCDDGSEEADRLMGVRWREKGLTVSQAGEQWLDFTISNKGTGIKDLCSCLGVRPEEVMAFGDNHNDISMLDVVGYPVIMENASEELRGRYAVHSTRVEPFLRNFLNEIK